VSCRTDCNERRHLSMFGVPDLIRLCLRSPRKRYFNNLQANYSAPGLVCNLSFPEVASEAFAALRQTDRRAPEVGPVLAPLIAGTIRSRLFGLSLVIVD
jgi:hypothetical protein